MWPQPSEDTTLIYWAGRNRLPKKSCFLLIMRHNDMKNCCWSDVPLVPESEWALSTSFMLGICSHPSTLTQGVIVHKEDHRFLAVAYPSRCLKSYVNTRNICESHTRDIILTHISTVLARHRNVISTAFGQLPFQYLYSRIKNRTPYKTSLYQSFTLYYPSIPANYPHILEKVY